jgi:hypothetical protein
MMIFKAGKARKMVFIVLDQATRQSWNGKTTIKLTLLAPTMRITPDGKSYVNFMFPLSSFTSYGEFLIMPFM